MSADLDKLERAIDRAAREMLDVEPPVDLRARVMAQLLSSAGAPVEKPAGFRLPASGWVFGAVAAAILLTVFVTRRSEPIAPPARVVAHASDVRLPNAIAPTVEQHVVAPSAAPRSVPTAASRTIAAATLADAPSIDIEPLKRIAPIAVAPLTGDDITPADISPRPLVPITEMQIPPLTPPDRR